jgi:hypothetical protein
MSCFALNIREVAMNFGRRAAGFDVRQAGGHARPVEHVTGALGGAPGFFMNRSEARMLEKSDSQGNRMQYQKVFPFNESVVL